jgi:hypothetical protein
MDRRDHAFRLSSLDINQNGLSSEGRLILAPKNPPAVVAPTTSSANTPTNSSGIAGVGQKTR